MGPCTLARLCFCAALAFSRKNPIRSSDGRRALGTPFERNLENRPHAKLRGSDPPERTVPRPVVGRTRPALTPLPPQAYLGGGGVQLLDGSVADHVAPPPRTVALDLVDEDHASTRPGT